MEPSRYTILTTTHSYPGQVIVDLTQDSDDDDDDAPIVLPQTMVQNQPAIPLLPRIGMRTATAFVTRPSIQSVPHSTPSEPSRISFISETESPKLNETALPPSPCSITSSDNPSNHHRARPRVLPRNYVSAPPPLRYGVGTGDLPERAAKRLRVSTRNAVTPPLLLQDMHHHQLGITTQTQVRHGSVSSQSRSHVAIAAHGPASKFHPTSFQSRHSVKADGMLSNGCSGFVPAQQQPRDRHRFQAQSGQELITSPAHNLSAKTTESNAPSMKADSFLANVQDHYLIFLKEVKQYPWKQITEEFNREFPTRSYGSLQVHYSTYLNKRDRSQDPAVLLLPPRFASESAVNWQTVHAKNPGPRATSPSKLVPERETTELIYDKGVHHTLRRDRPHRAKRVDYTQPIIPRTSDGIEANESDEADADFWGFVDDHFLSESVNSLEEVMHTPHIAKIVGNDAMLVDHVACDAEIARRLRKQEHVSTSNLPYLSKSQRLGVQATCRWNWDRLRSQHWQGSLLHVDFSPFEIETIKQSLAKLQKHPRSSRHKTQRRQLRDLLRNFTPPDYLELISDIRRRIPIRDRASIGAFLRDAEAGEIADKPQIKRTPAARPQRGQKTSTLHILRQRETGCYSNRGWGTASRAVTYQIKNQLMDTMGPASCWTGASSDVHVVAWAPNGESFAVGAVAVDDIDSMQYNRPNNLLYANLSKSTIHELGEHTKNRTKTESGANSSHAMFVSQDPKLYTTISSVAFSTSGALMYSTGYDGTICVWHTGNGCEYPSLGSKLNARAKIDIMTINRHHPGVIATAAKITESKAVRLLAIDEEDPSRFSKHSFHSEKAASRSDLKILPTALQFEPTYGGLLLAGFGANVRDQGFDATGDLCLWDIQSLAQLPVHGSNKNIFDIEFNPNRSSMPLFAIGCVAGGSVNRGTRSLLRLYDENGPEKYRCPIEIECKALDMNEISWNPYDEHLIAVGCTNGRAYVWDTRKPSDPICTLAHGRSLTPLQVDVPHEVTDTGVRFLSWGDNGTRLYSGSSDGTVKVWDTTRSAEEIFVKDLVSFDSGIMSGAFCSDMSKLVVGEVNGSVNVLEVGRHDCVLRDAEKLRYVPYDDGEDSSGSDTCITSATATDGANSGVTEGNLLLHTGQMKVAPQGGLPIFQVVQGPHYAGPFDQSVDAPFLREQALQFQLAMAAELEPQCRIAACQDTIKITNEDLGDSGRSQDRIPDQMNRNWKALDREKHNYSGRRQCTCCGRPARPSVFGFQEELSRCESCSFACFRCGTVTAIDGGISFVCRSCAGAWELGSLGYECVLQPASVRAAPDHVPTLERFGQETYLAKLEDADTSFGDEMNALTDYYFSLAVDRPESPPP